MSCCGTPAAGPDAGLARAAAAGAPVAGAAADGVATGAPAADAAAATATVCPVCLARVPGRLERAGAEVYLERRCPEHGVTRALIWRGPPDYDAWRGVAAGAAVPAPPAACPAACGACAEHAQGVCCVLLEVTARCDLSCPVCFAGAGVGAPGGDPALATIDGWYRRLAETAPGGNVQLSGGEPTVRDDLPAIVARGREHGFSFVQLNTNGLRLAREPGYAATLAAAGLSTVFLQFDGLDDAPYLALRGAPLAADKRRAIEACGAAGLGVVLVPTVAAGVNLDSLGAILAFALDGLPVVRGVHVQPLAHLGRYGGRFRPDDARRVTLPDAMRALVEQSGGLIALDDFSPGDCEHALCSFQAEYLRQPDGSLVRLRHDEAGSCCGPSAAPADAGPGSCCGSAVVERDPSSRCAAPAPASTPAPCCGAGVAPERKAAHVAGRWSASASGPAAAPAADAARSGEWDEVLRRVRGNTFSLSGMAFQDAWTLDLDRLSHCYLHVMRGDGALLPFCAFNLTDTSGRGLAGGRT